MRILRFPIVQHVAGVFASTSLLMFPPLMLSAGGHGLGSFPPPMIALYAAGITVAFMLPLALFFQWLWRRKQISIWFPPLVFFFLASLLFLPLRHLPSAAEWKTALLAGLFLTGGFAVYWLIIVVGQRMAKRRAGG